VTYGSPSFRVADFDGFQVSDITFSAGLVLPPHTHERAVLAVTLSGHWNSVIRGRARDCSQGIVLTEPAEERHANQFGSAGARVVLVQADPLREEVLRSCRQLLEEINVIRPAEAGSIARRIAMELAAPDGLSALAVESAALELFLVSARATAPRRTSRPAWLLRARELAEDRFLKDWSLCEFAAQLGVHPAHLSRAFRREYGSPLGSYIRRLRLQWAAKQLASTHVPISEIALQAGFADQSHFTRAFARFAGLSPGNYRRSAHFT
jgi:AraC family transcriptional regulator